MPYIGNTIRAADDYRLIDDISSGFNGNDKTFALQVAGSAPVPFPKSPQQVLISVNGVIQEPDPTGTSGFNLVGTNIVFSSAPTNGHAFFGIIYATADYLNAGGNFPAGSLGAPSITFVGDENTGLFRKGGGSIGFVADATEIANTDSNGLTISSGNLIIPDSIIHNADPNTKIRFPAADTVSVENGGQESLRIDSSGRLIVGAVSSNNVGAFGGAALQVEGLNAATSAFSIIRHSADTVGSSILMGKTRGTSDGATTVVQNNDVVARIIAYGGDGTDTASSLGAIQFDVDGTPGSNDMPGRIVFSTTADGADTYTERLRIDAKGNLLVNTTVSTLLANFNTNAGGLVLDDVGSGASVLLATHGTRQVFLGADTAHNYLWGYSDNNLYIGTNNLTRVGINSSGGVDIFNNSSNAGVLKLKRGSGANEEAILFYDSSNLDIETREATGIRLKTNTGNRLVISSAGTVGIGVDSPSNMLDVKSASGNSYITTERATKAGGQVGIQIKGASGGKDWYLYQHTDENILRIYNTSDGNLIEFTETGMGFTAGKGINFGASAGSGATSTILDDYEEGTFTPTISSGGTSISYTIARGSYTRIGDLVHCQIDLMATGTANSSVARIGGLPFTSLNQATQAFGGAFLAYANAAFPRSGDDRALFHVLTSDVNIAIYNEAGSVLRGSSSDVDILGDKEFLLVVSYKAV